VFYTLYYLLGFTLYYLPKDANLARDEEADSDCWVDVSTTDVCDPPDDRGDAETERQSNLDDIGRLSVSELGTRAACDQHQ